MRHLSGLVFLLGCSDYQVHSTAKNSGAVTEDDAPLVDTADMDTGAPIVPIEDGPLVGETPPPDEEPPEIETPDEPVYLHTSETLYSWDPESGTLGIVGNFFRADEAEIEGITDIAIDASGRFYGVSFSTLYGINGHTAEIWPISALDFPLFGLTCTSDGRLVGGGDGLVEIDPLTGAISTLVPEGHFETSGDLVGLPDGLLYWAVREGDELVVVDPNSGVTVPRGEIGVEHIYGLAYASGALYGFTPEGQVLEISPTTGDVLSQAALPGAWYGATANPVLW
jgi:hypothetical protein